MMGEAMVQRMVLATGAARTLGVSDGARLRFGELDERAPNAGPGRRLLILDEKPAFELSFWCGTCQFLFERLEGANETLSLDEMTERLTEGLEGLDDDLIETFGALLPRGDYVPILLAVQPRLVRPIESGDYFAEEQVETWGLESFWGLPVNPRTPYYRTFETAVDPEAHLFEFVVPMVPPSWNTEERVDQYVETLRATSRPTAVGVSIVDVSAPAVDMGPDWCAHWGLTHFLLDGHHKMEAAARAGTRVQLLSLLSVDASLASTEQVERVPELREQPRMGRVADG